MIVKYIIVIAINEIKITFVKQYKEMFEIQL